MVQDERIRSLILMMVEKIKKEYRPEKIILFGSFAYGEPTEDSDIDLFIVKDTSKRPVDRRVEVRKLIYDQKRRVPVSPLVFTRKEVGERLKIGDDFFEEITTKGEVLYEKIRIAYPKRLV